MAEVVIQLGGRGYPVACADGQEPRLHALGAMLAERWPIAQRAAGTGPPERAMLLLALMLADALDEACGKGAFEELILVAPRRSLGELRGLLSKRVQGRVRIEVPKDLTNEPPSRLWRRLAPILVPIADKAVR